MSSLTVGAAQIECRPGDVAANLALHFEAIEAARGQGVDCLVFPELSLTDYQSEPDTTRLARPADAPEMLSLARAAGPMTVAVGFIERGLDGRASNAIALLTDGGCFAVHRKLNLPTYGQLQETRHYVRGDAVRPASLGKGWTVATLVCADAWNPALPWLAALQHATLLLLPVASALDAVGEGFDNPSGWDVTLRHIALTYGLPTVMTNHCGSRGGLRFWGGSCILDASGRRLATLGPEAGLAVATLDLADVLAARRRLPTIRDADPALVGAELQRVLGASVVEGDGLRPAPNPSVRP